MGAFLHTVRLEVEKLSRFREETIMNLEVYCHDVSSTYLQKCKRSNANIPNGYLNAQDSKMMMVRRVRVKHSITRLCLMMQESRKSSLKSSVRMLKSTTRLSMTFWIVMERTNFKYAKTRV